VLHAGDIGMRGKAEDEITVHDDSGCNSGVRVDDHGDRGGVRQL
jgi:hypothetical protein